MPDLWERRAQDRLQLRESEVFFKQNGLLRTFNKYLGPREMIDISKSGMGFITTLSVMLHETVRVKVKIPGEPVLKLQGEVRWVADSDNVNEKRIGVQFMPFGNGRRYNSPVSLVRLSLLSGKYN